MEKHSILLSPFIHYEEKLSVANTDPHHQLLKLQECKELGLPISRKATSCNNQGLLANRERILEQLMNTFDSALQDEFFEVEPSVK
jgi:hypothetical protein